MTVRTLIPIFADQLSTGLSALKASNTQTDRIIMMEVAAETDLVPHHRKKIAFLFSAMRHFAEELRAKGWEVDYVTLADPNNKGSFDAQIAAAVAALKPDGIRLTEPGEWRVLEMAKAWQDEHGIPVEILFDDRFVCDHKTFKRWADGRKQLRMEYFYRDMRRQTGLLMDGEEPAGGKWNYDAENRKPPKDGLSLPARHTVEPDQITQEVLDMVADRFPDRFGDLDGFDYAVTAKDAEEAVDQFIDDRLVLFGDFQDAMMTDEPYMAHAVIGLYLNAGLLDPLDVCRKAEHAYLSGHAPLNAVEGFIRQIIGWREFIRGIYWLKMPNYADVNFFGADRALPAFYWTAETDMHCMAQAIGQTKAHAYAHHIQRLMVTGNFAMLAGIAPKEISDWYLAVYADAFEWVEMPNVLGMSQFADGGLLGSKPYAAGGNYINKMSTYCKDCAYKISAKTGAEACPFNYLYWDFLARHEDTLAKNPRMAQMYRTWGRMDADKKRATRASAQHFLERMDKGERV